jgi:hypothetical protein
MQHASFINIVLESVSDLQLPDACESAVPSLVDSELAEFADRSVSYLPISSW